MNTVQVVISGGNLIDIITDVPRDSVIFEVCDFDSPDTEVAATGYKEYEMASLGEFEPTYAGDHNDFINPVNRNKYRVYSAGAMAMWLLENGYLIQSDGNFKRVGQYDSKNPLWISRYIFNIANNVFDDIDRVQFIRGGHFAASSKDIAGFEDHEIIGLRHEGFLYEIPFGLIEEVEAE